MRPDRPGREGPGPAMRGASTANRGRTSFNSRDGGRPVVMGDQVRPNLSFLLSVICSIYIKKSFS